MRPFFATHRGKDLLEWAQWQARVGYFPIPIDEELARTWDSEFVEDLHAGDA